VTLLLEGVPTVDANPFTAVDRQLLKRTIELLAKELPPGKAASLAAQLTGATRSEAYGLVSKRGRKVP